VTAVDAGRLEGVDVLAAAVAGATSVVAVGGRTQFEVGGAPDPDAIELSPPAGVVAYDPRHLTVTIGGGTTVADLASTLAEHGQQCPLDPRDPTATVGGLVATGLSGHRRLRYGPLRDCVLEVRFVTAEGRVVKAGGPTVKNVTGFDLPRLLVGSLGTLGIIVQVILRCQPLLPVARWYTADTADPFDVRRRTFRPSTIAWDGTTTSVLLEGVEADLAVDADAARATPAPDAPAFPTGEHRGRISVRPGALRALATALDRTGARWLAEVGVGTVHVAADSADALLDARAAAEVADGWMLRETGAPGAPGFGCATPNRALMTRIRDAFDPTHKLGRGRLDELLAGGAPDEVRRG
jgi:glycolate oxidase FAD binding subunit